MPTTSQKQIIQGGRHYLVVSNRGGPAGTTEEPNEPLVIKNVSTTLLEVTVGDVVAAPNPADPPTFTPNAATGRALEIKAKPTGNPVAVNTSILVDAIGVDGSNELTVPISCLPVPPSLDNIQESVNYGPFAPPPSQPSQP